MSIIRSRFDYIGTPLLAGIFGILFILESRYQLRKRVQNRWARIKINAAVATPSFILLRLIFIPAMVFLAKRNQRVRSALKILMPIAPSQQMMAFFFLDYSNYLWHILNHKLPFLWRFHLVHHTDRDLDISTAFRFHFGEMIGSIFYRGACTFFSGATPLTVIVYEIIFEGATEFHHSNMRLPLRFEQLLNKVIVTPRMHGIHHSVDKNQVDSNFSVIFSLWDRLHQTLNLDVKQTDLIIGVPNYQNDCLLSANYLLRLPFKTKLCKIRNC